jgi:hypothetical protein
MRALITTEKDTSAPIFANHGWKILLYSDEITEPTHYETVYFRDPFNGTMSAEAIRPCVNRWLKGLSWNKSIDDIESFRKMKNLEDKYRQYKKFKSFMPAAYLPSEHAFVEGKNIAKKRISQRAKDILFRTSKKLNDDWIIQDKMNIKEELRVYAIFGKVIKQASIKSSKTEDTKVKVIGGRDLTPDEIALCERIAEESKLDFIGIDLAILDSGEYKLIEVNRSPQFGRFVERYGDAPLSGILD